MRRLCHQAKTRSRAKETTKETIGDDSERGKASNGKGEEQASGEDEAGVVVG